MKHTTDKGITLIALVITIIVLLILSGISISLLSDNNSILRKAGEAREKTEETQRIENVKIAIMGSYDSYANLNLNNLLDELNKIKGITITPAEESGLNAFPVTVETEKTAYKITSDGKLNEVEVADRTGINIGDYITYSPKKSSVTFSTEETGENEEQTLNARSSFRVMDIDKYGNITLVGVLSLKPRNNRF